MADWTEFRDCCQRTAAEMDEALISIRDLTMKGPDALLLAQEMMAAYANALIAYNTGKDTDAQESLESGRERCSFETSDADPTCPVCHIGEALMALAHCFASLMAHDPTFDSKAAAGRYLKKALWLVRRASELAVPECAGMAPAVPRSDDKEGSA